LIFEILPSVAIVSFIGLLTILLSIASLELNSKKEFELDKVVKAHGATSIVAAIFGGFVGIISISRTTLNQSGGGGKLSGFFASLICLAFFLGAGNILSFIPKAALGGLILFLGIGMLKQWLWDQRKLVSKVEFAQIFLILFLVANFGYFYGFIAGIIISCFIFIITYSQIGLAFPKTYISEFSSTVVRSEEQTNFLKVAGNKVAIYRLNGYVFFGSASKIDALFKSIDMDSLNGVIIDFSCITGIDRSAIGVFQRILRRYSEKNLHFYLVLPDKNRDLVKSITPIDGYNQVSYYSSLDAAIECAEQGLLNTNLHNKQPQEIFNFLDNPVDSESFKKYCTID
jgi:SulP family sulfate permease